MEKDSITKKYCIYHGEIVFVAENDTHVFYHPVASNSITGEFQVRDCYGPFAEVAPPPPLTEEEWVEVFSAEEVAQW